MAQGWGRRAVCGGLVASAAGAAASPLGARSTPGRGGGERAGEGRTTALVLLQANLSARTPSLLQHAAHVEALPFDGVTVNIPASWSVMQPGVRLAYQDVYPGWLAPLRDRLRPPRRDFVLAAVRKAADPFDDWAGVIDNWRVLAQAARDAGLAGILFDNEPYFERLWQWPVDTDYPYPLQAYQERYRERGRELMTALSQVWPDIHLLVLHGPYVSEPRTPRSVTLEQTLADGRNLAGHFFVGLVQGAGPGARVIDGGEVYQYRTGTDFARSYAWRKRQLAGLPQSTLIPPALRRQWPERVSVGFGLYDLAWKKGFPMSPPLLERALGHALATADDYAWLFTESQGPRDYLVPSRAAEPWLEAIRAARRGQQKRGEDLAG